MPREGIEERIASLLASFAQAQADANRQLVETFLTARANQTDLPAAPSPTLSTAVQISGNFAKCSARFSGAGSSDNPDIVEAFIDSVKIYKECVKITDEHALQGLPMLLEGEAAVWYRGIKTSITSWEDAVAKLRSMYGTPRPPHKIFREIFAKEQQEERTESFIARLHANFARLPYAVDERMQLDIIYGLLRRSLRERIARDKFKNMDELYEQTRNVEESLAEGAATQQVSIVPTLANNVENAADARRPAQAAPARVNARQSEPTARATARVSGASPVFPADSRAVNAIGPKGKLFCVYCRKSNHNRDTCLRLKNKSESVPNNASVSCSRCKNPGVTRSDCDRCNSFSSCDIYDRNYNTDTYYEKVSMCVPRNSVSSHRSTMSKSKHNVNVHAYENLSLRDTIVSDKSFSNAKSVLTDSVVAPTISALGESTVRFEDRPILDIVIGGCQGTGLIDTASKRSIAGFKLYKWLQRKGHPFRDSEMMVKLADGVVRNFEVKLADIRVKLAQNDLEIPITFVIFTHSCTNDTLLGIDFIRKARLVINIDSNSWFTADRPHAVYPLRYESSRSIVGCASANVLRVDEGSNLTPVERTELTALLDQYDDVFKEGSGPTPFAEHAIDTGDHSPLAVPPYRLTPAKRAIMEKELDKMLRDGIIEECESAWAAPALLVPKKDGSYRFCVDYRKLNAITKSDSYPLPVIDDLLQYTGRSCVLSTIDLRAGYWQVCVRKEDQDKTAFVTPFGVHRFKRMPFGLRNAPATFQRLLDRFKSGASLKGVTLLGYIDDLIVISDSFGKHLQDLRAVFERLRSFSLQANRDKCVFARESVKYLGHVISAEGISPDPEKVSAIQGMKQPTTVKHIKSFLQTCSWFRKFIPGFAKIAQPLTMLTKKNQTWIWGESQEHAFTELKRLLTSTPILIQPDYSQPFILRTDASSYALGAALLQGETAHEERPIAYASRLLIAAERNYSTTEREALAVVWACEKFRGYIDGHPVRVASDHQPLKWLLTLKSPTGRLVRWALKLQAFDLQVEYTPGKLNVLADTLSRPPCDEQAQETCDVCTVIVDTPRWNAESVRESQLADPEVAKIIQGLEGKDEIAIGTWTERGYHMSGGVLYRYTDSETEEPQLVVPEELRKQVMAECHDSATSGHGGIERTLHRISQRFYFPGMRRYVTDYLKTCIECQRYKPNNHKPAGLLQTPVPSQRFEVVAVDLFGPLPKGPNGERWVLIVEDTASRWVELFALIDATAEACARILIEEVYLRFGLPRKLISDNGVQFIADVMQHAMFVLGIKQSLVPLYHPEANPVERKNRDLKSQLAILVENEHRQWAEALPFIRFALNTSLSKSTKHTPAYLTFARELRSPITAQSDLRAIIEAENYVPQITPYLLKLAVTLGLAKEAIEHEQDANKATKDQTRREAEEYIPGDLVLLRSHVLSNARMGVTAKLTPKRDGPYLISRKVSPTTYVLAHCGKPDDLLGKYHATDLRRYHARDDDRPEPVRPKRRRGRPRKFSP